MTDNTRAEMEFADELRKWWSFDDGQMHTHSWHSREDFIAKRLPELLAAVRTTPAPAQGGGIWVPLEPTEHQVLSARGPYEILCALSPENEANWKDAFVCIYKAMLSAAPSPAQGDG